MAMAAAKSRDEAPRPRAQDIDRHVGTRMRERRIMLGLTQQQMADLIGVTYQQAHKYEKGINRIAAGRLSTIAQALGVEVSYFFEDAEADQASVEPSPQQRLLLELARSFVALPSRKHQEAICNLARVLANHDLGDALDTAIEDQATAA
jgi:transcriptional regulator with XRE-family HTH domain